MDKLSFIIPAYNCEKTIEEAINSCLNQNLKIPFEIIVVDDASTDKTNKILMYLKEKNIELKVFKNKINRGGSYTRNRCVKKSLGNLIFCLDSDNILIENSLQPLIDLLLKTNSQVASFSHLKYFSGYAKKVFLNTWEYKNTNGFCLLDDVIESCRVPISSGNYLFTRKAFDSVKGYPLGVGAIDAWGFGFKLLVFGYKIALLNNSNYLHRVSKESYWLREIDNNNDNIVKLFIKNKDIFNEKSKKIIFSSNFKKDPFYFIEGSFLRLKKSNRWFLSSKVKNVFYIISRFFNNILKFFKKSIKKLILFFYKIINKIFRRINFVKQFIYFKYYFKDNKFSSIKWSDRYPCLNDNTNQTNFDSHYIYHPAWAARIIKKINPKKHIDISSTLTFCSIVSAFVPVDFYDFRPANLTLSNLKSKRADLTNLYFKSNSIESLSCMHTIEHIGLGRYGDEIDPDGDIKAINELKRVVKKNGSLLIVIPIGKSKICFNAHRIYSFEQVLSYFGGFKLCEFALVTDEPNHKFIINPVKKITNSQNYGCGCFYFKKK